jgi:site-specific recombinase XerD
MKVSHFFVWLESQGVSSVDAIEPNHLRAFFDELRAKPGRFGGTTASYTLNGYGRCLHAFLRYCAQEDMVSERLVRKLVVPKAHVQVLTTFTPAHIAALYRACDDARERWLAERDKAVVRVLVDTGIRANELCDLTLERTVLTMDESMLVVNGKGRKQRVVGLGRKSRAQLHRYIHRFRQAPESERHTFVTRDGRPLNTRALDDLVKRLRDKSGVSGVRCSAHTFRHTYACRFIEAGGDIYRLSRLLGHASASITEHYLRDFNQRVASQGISVFDNL